MWDQEQQQKEIDRGRRGTGGKLPEIEWRLGSDTLNTHTLEIKSTTRRAGETLSTPDHHQLLPVFFPGSKSLDVTLYGEIIVLLTARTLGK